MGNLAHRASMEALEESIRDSGAMVDLECKHYFAHGTYTRELYIPKHTVLTGKIHLHSTINIISQGKIRAVSEEGQYDIEAPHIFVSGAMVKKAGFTLEDTIWINVFPWDGKEEEPEMVVDKLTVPTYDLLEGLPMSVAWVAAGATVANGVLSYKGAKDAAKTQADSADKALEVFEKNAGIATAKLEETSNEAIGTLRDGQAKSEDILKSGADATIKTLSQGKADNHRDILAAYGIQEGQINEVAANSSKYINAARESAANSISSGFSAGKASIIAGRDLVNKVLQETTDIAEEKLDLARAGAIAAQERGLSAIRSDFEPYLSAGKVSAEELEKLVNDPNAQKEFITNNPFFDALAKDAEDRLLQNQAAKGRVGTGSTQEALHENLLKLGSGLLDASINQRLNTANLGLNAANSVASAEMSVADAISTIEQQTGKSLSDLNAQLGVNKGNNIRESAKNLADLSVEEGKALADNEMSSARSLADIEMNRGDQLTSVGSTGIANLVNSNTNFDTNIAKTQDNLTTNLTNLNTATNSKIANTQENFGVHTANVLTENASNVANTTIGQGDVTASGIVAGTNAVTGTIKDLTSLAVAENERKKLAAGAEQ